MTFVQWVMLVRLTFRESGGVPIILTAMLAAIIPVFVSTVANNEIRTVAVAEGRLLPQLVPALEKVGFAVRQAEPDESTDTKRGIVVLRVSEEGPIRRLVQVDSMLNIGFTTFDALSRISRAIALAASDLRMSLAKDAGLSPDAMDPVFIKNFDERRLLAFDSTPRSDPTMVFLEAVIRRSSLVALAVGWSLALATCVSVLVFGRRSGRLQALICVPVTPLGHTWAIMASAALSTGISLMIVDVVIAVILGWFGIAFPLKFVLLPILGALYSATLAPFACIGISFFRNAKLSMLFGSIVTMPVLAMGYLPYATTVAGFDNPWLHAVPFEGLTLWTLTGQVGTGPAMASLASTLALLALGQWMASSRLNARLYLGHDD